MTQNLAQKASIPNPALESFSLLIGTWDTTRTHGLLPDSTLHSRISFDWLEGGAFLMMRSEIDDPRFPQGIAIIGSDDSGAEYYMLTFGERGVSRKYEVLCVTTSGNGAEMHLVSFNVTNVQLLTAARQLSVRENMQRWRILGKG